MSRDLKILVQKKDTKQVLTFGLPISEKFAISKGEILAGDIGASKSHFALFKLIGGHLKFIREKVYATQRYSSFYEIFQDFTAGFEISVDIICLGVAGPVIEGRVKGTNFSWKMDQLEIAKKTGIKKVLLINDMEANAMGLNFLEPADFMEIKKGVLGSGNAAIISPGTGLGEVGLFRRDNHFYSFATEGGHCLFSPGTDEDVALWRYLHLKYGLVSWERILSGRGIYDLYQFLVATRNISEPNWFKERIHNEDPAAVISSCAIKDEYYVCTETIDLFVKYLAVEASLFSLKILSTGGIYFGGGILPKILPILNLETFRKNFINSNQMAPILKKIPVQVILDSHTTLFGAAYCGAMSLEP